MATLSPAVPVRSRCVFARRHPVVALVVVLLAITLGARLWWGWHIDRRLEAQLTTVRERGDPATEADLEIVHLADSENAWVLIQQAAKLDTGNSPGNSTETYPAYPPYNDVWEKLAVASEKDNARVFQLARRARTMPKSQIVGAVVGPLPTSAFSNRLYQTRAVALTLCDGAIFLHLRGEDAEALGRLHDAARVGDAIGAEGGLGNQLVAGGLYALTARSTQIIAPELKLNTPAAQDAAADLLRAFLVEEPIFRTYRRAIGFDRHIAIANRRRAVDRTWAIRPLAEIEIVKSNDQVEAQVAAAAEHNYAAATRAFDAALPQPATPKPAGGIASGPAADESSTGPRYSRWFDKGMDTSGSHRLIRQFYQVIGERRVTAIALAIALYRADHAGQFPDRLDELVPMYLPALPADPFRVDGRPISYTRLKHPTQNGVDRPVLWLDAGEDIPEAIDVEPKYDWFDYFPPSGRRRQIRQYRDLTRWLPPTRRSDPPTSVPEAVDDDPEQPEAPRDDAEKHDEPQK